MNSIKDPFIVKVFEASTSHITQKDDQLLKRENLCTVSAYEIKGGGILYGFLVYTSLEENSSIVESGIPDEAALKAEGFSDAFINLLKLAKKNGCKFLQLDCDGVEYEDLPKFNW